MPVRACVDHTQRSLWQANGIWRLYRSAAPALCNEITGVSLSIRPRIARRPAAGLDAGDEICHRVVEQRRLLLVHYVAGLGHHQEARSRDPLFEQEARLQTRLILV